MKLFGSEEGEAPLDARAFALVASLAAALARLFFDIGKAQPDHEKAAINISGAGQRPSAGIRRQVWVK